MAEKRRAVGTQSFQRVAVGEKGEVPGSRAYREAFLYQMINYFDDQHVHMVTGQDAKTDDKSMRMTIEQKRRLRNRIFENAKALEADGQGSVYDPEVLVKAFFETGFGSEFKAGGKWDRIHASYSPEDPAGFFERQWSMSKEYAARGPGRKAVTAFDKTDAVIRSWTYGNFKAGSKEAPTAMTTLVSPYDPLFKHSELFDDDSDTIGYVIGDENGNKYLTDEGFIKSVFFPREYYIQSKRKMTEQAMQSSDKDMNLEGPVSASGYLDIEHYIHTREDKAQVKKYLTGLVEADPNGNGIRPEELEFINDVCSYLYGRGVDFNVCMGSNDHLCARVENPSMEIRLLSRDDELHTGRIYANGVVTRLTISGDGLGSDLNRRKEIASRTITNEDRLNMIKWYFGERVRMVRDDKAAKSYQIVGMTDKKVFPQSIVDYTNTQRKKVSVPEGKELPNGYKSAVSGFLGATKPSTRSVGYSAILSIRKSPSKGRGHEVVKVYVSRGNPGLESDFANKIDVKKYFNTKDDSVPTYEKLRDIVPESKILPDFIPEYEGSGDGAVPKLDEEGRPYAGRAEYERDREYYDHLLVREHLAAWVESAKAHHRELMDIDGMVAHLADVYVENESPDYVFSDDDNVAELQEKAWKYLREAFNHGGKKFDEAVTFLRAEYDKYQAETFGFVPEIVRPGLEYDEPAAEYMGFNPDMTARYVDLPESTSVQKNQTFIMHMLDALGSDYSTEPGRQTVRGDSYFTNKVKNDMVRYNPDATLASIRLVDVAIDPANGAYLIDDKKFEEAIENSGLAGQPFRAAAVKETMRMLMESGCNPNTVAVRMDEKGIMDYTGYVFGQSEVYEAMDQLLVDGGKLREFATFENSKELADFANKRKLQRIRGQIGQVFEPDRYGAIIQDTVVPDDRVLIPGYEAYLIPSDPENPLPMRDRLRLIGIQQQMMRAIDMNIRTAVTMMQTDYNFVAHTTDLNTVYSHAYDTVLDKDYYLSRLPQTGKEMTDEQRTFLNVIRTLQGRCRFPNEYGEGSTTMAQSYLENPHTDAAKTFDYFYSDLCGNQNLRVLGHYFDGVFDPNATGNAKTQGIVRYLAEGARVDGRTGTVIPYEGDDEDLKQCRLMTDPVFDNMYFDSWDRRLMAMNQVLTALGTPRKVGTAMMNMKGWNFDDGFVISKEFAEANQIEGADGNLRPLMTQDKLSDFHGNKGVIARVIDPNLISERLMRRFDIRDIEVTDLEDEPFDLADPKSRRAKVTFEDKTFEADFTGIDKALEGDGLVQARKALIVDMIQDQYGVKGMDDIMRLFDENPSLQVVQAPYSGMSRFNGGSIRDLMSKTEPLVLTKDGKTRTIPGGIGFTNFIVVDMPADVKTHIYDEEAVLEGKGRKASGQLAWALQSKGCRNILNEFYGQNQGALDDIREYAICIGLDFDEKMRPLLGFVNQDSRGERRALTKLPSMEDAIEAMQERKKPDAEGAVTPPSYRDLLRIKGGSEVMGLSPAFERMARTEMMKSLNKNGGFMEIPFPLTFSETEGVTLPTGQTYSSVGGDKRTYGYPVLPISLRSGMELLDGTSRVHDYTNRYLKIYTDALTFMVCEMGVKEEDKACKAILEAAGCKSAEDLSEADRKKYNVHDNLKRQMEGMMVDAHSDAQGQANKVTADIVERRFNNKHNVVRDGIMARRIPQSGTAVWSADPRLDLNQIAVGRAAAEKLGLMTKEGKFRAGSEVLVWRDPILHDDNVRCMEVVLDESILGVAINPLMDKPFDGDFDGDSVAVVPLKTAAARAEAYKMFSLEANLLQKGVTPDENGDYPLYIQTGLDVKTVMAEHPELKEEYDRLAHEINEFERAAAKWRKEESPENYKAIAFKNKDGEFVGGETAIRENRRAYMHQLSGLMHRCLDDFGSACIDFTDERSVMSSLIDIADTKAKGDRSKLGEFANNFGVELVGPAVKEKGWETEDKATILGAIRPIVKDGETVSLYTRDGIQDQKDHQIEETTAYKADNTALGGTTAQQAMAAFRNFCPTAALELSYPTTQGILQSKHDPLDAKTKDKIVRFWGKDVWDGYALTGTFEGEPADIFDSPHNKKKITLMNDDGVEVSVYEKATPEQWRKQMLGMFKALKVDVNPKYLDDMIRVMTRKEDTSVMDVDWLKRKDRDPEEKPPFVNYGKGTVAGVSEFSAEAGTLLDRMAYSGKFKALLREAKKWESPKKSDSVQSLLGPAYEKAQAIEEAKRELRRMPKKDTADKRAVRMKLEAARAELSNVATFVPDTFISEAYYDAIRASTPGKTTNTVIHGSGETAVEVEVPPRPLGSRNCRLTEKQYAEGVAYMGESEANYRKRLAGAFDMEDMDDDAMDAPFDRQQSTDALVEDVKEPAVAASAPVGPKNS